MTALTDQIAVAFRDYITAGVPASGNYKPTKADTRSILTTMATGAQWISSIQTFLGAATTAAALTGVGLGTGDTPTFTGATLTNLTVDTSVLKVDGSTNRVGIGTASPSVAFDVDVAADFSSTVALAGATTVTATMAMTGSGKLVVGNATTPTVGALAGAETLAVTGTGNGASGSISRFSNDATAGRLTIYKSRGTSIGAQTVVQVSDVLGDLRFNGADGTTYAEGARVSAIVDATPGSGSMPTAMTFWTTAASASTSTERGRFDSSGRLLVNATSSVTMANSRTPLIQVHATTAALGATSATLWEASAVGPRIIMGKSRGAAVGTNTIVQSGDNLGILSWDAADGSAFVQSAAIYAAVDGTPGSSDMPGRLLFATTADGASGATERMRIDSAGLISLGGGTTTGIQTGTTNAIPFKASGSEIARINASGALVGHTAHVSIGSTSPNVQAHGATSAGFGAARWSNDANGPQVYFGKSRSTTIGTLGTIVQSGDILGQMFWFGDDGTALKSAAAIVCTVDGTPGADDMPGALSFRTTPDGSNSSSEAFKIGNGGVITFPRISTTASAANAFLDSGSSNSLLRSTSSIRYKRSIENVTAEETEKLLEMRPITYRSRAAADDPSRRWFGFIAEEMAEVEGRLVTYGPDEDGEIVPDGIQYERIVVLLVAKIKQLNSRIAAIETAQGRTTK